MAFRKVFFLLFLLHIAAAAQVCEVSKCSGDAVAVRFPFRLEGRQPRNCGYPGFNLMCNDEGITVLKLPYSGNFLVRDIGYWSQEIQIYDSDNCLPKRLLHFNLSGSPFIATFYQNFTFLRCPTELVKNGLTIIDCLSNSTISVLATTSIKLVNSLSGSCHNITTMPVPVPWPIQFDGFTTALNDDLQLTWYSPDCSECETRGGICGFKGNSTAEINCSYKSGLSAGFHVFKIICFSIAVPAMVLAAGIAALSFYANRRSRRNAGEGTWQNNTRAVTPQPPAVMTGLDECTIESYQKVVLGESKRLPGHDDTSCAICLSEYRSKETIRCIPECKHCFHADCIDEWLRMKGSCPVCRNSPSPSHAAT